MNAPPRLRLALLFLAAAFVPAPLLTGAHAAPAAAAPSALWWDVPQPSTADIARTLAPAPTAFGAALGDRAAWAAFAATATGKSALTRAPRLLPEPIPAVTDAVYLALQQSYTPETRAAWDNLYRARLDRLGTLTLAEAIEHRGRFTAAIADSIRSLCAERAWVFPGYDRQLADFEGKLITIDLFSSAVGWQLATTDHLLGAALPAEIRALIRAELQRRIFTPFRRMLSGQQPPHWLRYGNNWVSVCLAGVTGSALAVLESPDERAFFVGAAIEHSRKLLEGYGADGYCSEGVGYWNYGFGRYVLLAGLIHQASAGRIDLLARPAAYPASAYGFRIEIVPGVSPTFSDVDATTRPDPALIAFLDRRFGFGAPPPPDAPATTSRPAFVDDLFYRFQAPSHPSNPDTLPPLPPATHAWFPSGGVYVGRPSDNGGNHLAVAWKGGHNAEQHNHNDLGSFVVLVGRQPVIVDPGQEIRSGRTFSARRYESPLLNSLDHPVPRLAGTLQATGADARAEIRHHAFSAERDTVTYDLRSAYPVPSLRALTRTFAFIRAGTGTLEITDVVEFSRPESFESALITLGSWTQTGPRSLRVRDGGAAVDVTIEAGPHTLVFSGEEIYPARRTAAPTTRIAIRLAEPVARAEVRLTIRPASSP